MVCHNYNHHMLPQLVALGFVKSRKLFDLFVIARRLQFAIQQAAQFDLIAAPYFIVEPTQGD